MSRTYVVLGTVDAFDGFVLDLREAGHEVVPGWEAEDARPAVVLAGEVATLSEARAALVAATRGATIVVRLVADGAVADAFLEDARHIGEVDVVESAPATGARVTPEQLAILDLLAGGASLAEAAVASHISLRTAARRVAAARSTLGVRTTAEAVLATRR